MAEKFFSMVAACDDEMGIGIKGKLPWSIPSDLKFFSDVTTGVGTMIGGGEAMDGPAGVGKNAVIMGKTTWESLPKKHRPLAKRINIVLTRNVTYLAEGAIVAHDFESALMKAREQKAAEIFVIGGAQIYEQAIKHPNCKTLYITKVAGAHMCDAFFPHIDEAVFENVFTSKPRTENGHSFVFMKFRRR